MTTNLQLTAVDIQNYKSIRKADIPFGQQLAVFIGKNNSGKSNILDVFDFIHEAISDYAAALRKRGERIVDLLWAADPRNLCILRFSFSVPTDLLGDSPRLDKNETSTEHRLPTATPTSRAVEVSDGS